MIRISESEIREITSKRAGFMEGEKLDFSEGIAVPGFIDIHTHGREGASATSGEKRGFLDMAKSFGKEGVTSFLPTTWSSSHDVLLEACSAYSEAKKEKNSGSSMLGLHLEGPYFGKGEEKGAQNPDFLRPPDVEELRELIEASGGRIERVTLDPSLEGSLELIDFSCDNDILVSVGHTKVTYDRAVESFDRGVSLCTHLFNGMGSFHHRSPGIIGACLSTDVYAEIIADMLHVHPASIELATRAKGVDSMILVTDSISLSGLPDGEYELGGNEVVLDQGECRIKKNGRLAGSTLTMAEAIRNIVSRTNFRLEDAIKMASVVPARALSLTDRGRLEPGYRADITILNNDLEVIATVVGGEIIENYSS